MRLDAPQPLLIPARSAVLLIFLPSDRADHQQRSLLITFADTLQKLLGNAIRVLKIDEATHPEVVRSFEIIHVPTFVLVQQGIELWRQVGTPDAATLAQLAQRLLAT